MGKIVPLYRGYSVEIVETVANASGNNLEGFLMYNMIYVKDLRHATKYKSNSSLVDAFKTKVLPKYLKNKPMLVTDFILQEWVYKFVKEFILSTNVTWGYTVDLIKVLEGKGYTMPRSGDECFDIDYYNQYLGVVNNIGRELIIHLKQFGFTPDRRASDMEWHVPAERHVGCFNLIFTRYPWTSSVILQRSVTKALNLFNRDYIENVELETLKLDQPVLYKVLMDMNKALGDDAVKVGVILSKNYKLKSNKFTYELKQKVEQITKLFAREQPNNYGIYLEE